MLDILMFAAMKCLHEIHAHYFGRFPVKMLIGVQMIYILLPCPCNLKACVKCNTGK